MSEVIQPSQKKKKKKRCDERICFIIKYPSLKELEMISFTKDMVRIHNFTLIYFKSKILVTKLLNKINKSDKYINNDKVNKFLKLSF